MSRRTLRLNDLLREEISEIIRDEMRDPRLDVALLSVTEVEISTDLRHAKAFISMFASEEEQREAMKALDAARPYVQRLLRQRIPHVRLIPEVSFKHDQSIERGVRIKSMLDDLARERGEAAE